MYIHIYIHVYIYIYIHIQSIIVWYIILGRAHEGRGRRGGADRRRVPGSAMLRLLGNVVAVHI